MKGEKANESGIGGSSRRKCPRKALVELYDAVFRATSSSLLLHRPSLLHPPSTGPVSSQRRKLTLATLHQYAKACLPSYRISINPPTATLVQITGQNLYAKPDFRRSVITNDAAVRIRTFTVTSANVGCYKRRDGHDTLFGYEIDAFHRSLLSSRRCIAPFIGSDWSDTRYCCYVAYRIKNDCAYVNIDAILHRITYTLLTHDYQKIYLFFCIVFYHVST